jgi:glycosyltransferase involved in cell wall biosynthesis
MKIALVLTGGLHPSGREQVIPAWLWLLERLSARHEIHAFTLRHLPEPSTYALAGATIHDLGRPHGHWAQWRALRAGLALSGPFDVIHGYWADPAGVLAAIAGRRLGIPALVTCDSGEFVSIPEIDYGHQRTRRGRALVALACRLAARVHVTSQFMASLARTHGYDATCIPMGVDPDRVGAATVRAGRQPQRLLQVASLNRVKDQSTLLDALAIVRQTIDVRLDLVGEDTLGGRLQDRARSLGLAGAVSFHGFATVDRLAAFRESADLYVQSSLHEAAGVSVLEAAAAGLPIVGTNVGFVSDWAPHAACAVPPGNPQALADAIARLLTHPTECRRLADEAMRFARTNDVNATALALSDLYESVLRHG